MTAGGRHPVDEQGRVLPHPWWPRERQAPGELELVRRFCNSTNRENGADRFASAEGFDEWLRTEGRSPIRPNAEQLAELRDFREVLHSITVANHDRAPALQAWASLAALLGETRFMLSVTGREPVLRPVATTPTRAFLGELALICLRANQDGTLRRLKSCTNCEWTIYDSSKNQSGRWCSMTACGGRYNARTYRQRKRSPTSLS
jgi:predicted RNA-binding Zn ribbon-like protein